MKLALSPKEPTWWAWLVTAALLATGLTVYQAALVAAIALAFAHTIFFWLRHRSLRPITVQVRLGYTLLLLTCLSPFLRWFSWMLVLGTLARLAFGYCMLARILSLLPWNRHEALTFGLVRRTFFNAPSIARNTTLFPCGSEDGVCELEARVASLASRRFEAALPP
jgi:hypothetical protein